MSTINGFQRLGGDLGAFFNPNRLTVNDRLGNFLVGGGDGPGKSWLRDSHLLGSFFLGEAIDLVKFQGFQFIRFKDDLIENS